MNRKLVLGIAFLVIIAITFMLSSFFVSKKTLPPQRPIADVKNYVKVVGVAYTQVPVAIEAFGRVGSSQQLNIIAEVGGRLLPGSINLKEGENFKSGQLLVKINNSEQKLTLQSRKSTFLNLLASVLPDIKIDFPQSFAKWQSYYENIDLEQDLPKMPENLSGKERAFLASRNILTEYFAIKSIEENLKKYTIIAPYDGSIQSVNIEVGSVVNPGANIASIIRTDKLELKVPVELKDVDDVKIGAEVTVAQEGVGAKSWKGKVVRKADFVDANTQSVAVYIAINSANNDVYDGQYLKALIPGKVVNEGMIIERSVLRNKNEVFVVEGDRLATRVVNVEKIMQSKAIINGLKEGDLLVIDAPSNASNNMKVDIVK